MDNDEIHDIMMNLDLIYVSNPSPLVVLFGPATSGKTMALIRLSRLLINMGYLIVPDRSFRPDNHVYNEACDHFEKLLFSNYAAWCTSGAETLLVKVIDRKGEVVCQLLDAPGPFFFDPNIPQEPWHKSIDYIRNIQNKRVWLYFVEEGWCDGETRTRYAQRIKQHVFDSSRADKSVFVFSKVDNINYLRNRNRLGEVNMPPELFKAIGYQYPDIFTPFENKPPLKWFKQYNCRFVPFSSGFFHKGRDENGCVYQHYIESHNVYPEQLWKAILKSVDK